MLTARFNFTKYLRLVAILLIIAGFLGLTYGRSLAITGINRQINFQGKLVNTDGTNVTNGSYTIVFSIYDHQTAGTPASGYLWQESQEVTVTDGIFRVMLGSSTPFPANFNFNWSGLYLGMKVNSDNEMTPRIEMTAVPYAFNAEKVAGLTIQDESGNASTSGILKIPNAKTIGFTSAYNITVQSTADTTITLPTGGTLLTNTVSANQTITSTQTSGNLFSLVDSTGLTSGISALTIGLTSSTNSQNKTGISFDLSGGTGGTYYDLYGTGGTWSVTRGGALTVASCSGCGGAPGGANYWDITSGLLSSGNTTLDFALGGTSTSSAQFSISGINNNQAIASISGNFIVMANNGWGGQVGIGTTNPTEALDVSGNIKIGTNTTGTILATTELVLRQDGDTYGSSILRLRNRAGENGAIFETTDPTVTLVDFIFKTSASQRNIRYESRAASAKVGNPSFHIGGSVPDTPTLAVGDSYAAVYNKLRVGSYVDPGTYAFAVTGTGYFSNDVSASTFNNVTITQPATSATLTITDGKTLSIGNSLTLNGTDSTTFTFPSTTNGTVLTSNAPTQGVTSTQTSGTVLALADSTGLTSGISALTIGLTSSTNSQNKTGISFDLSGGTGGSYYDLYGTGGTWSMTRAGVLNVASCTGCGGAGSQTPWTSDIDADNFSLLDLGTNITARAGLTITSTGSNTLTLESGNNTITFGATDTTLSTSLTSMTAGAGFTIDSSSYVRVGDTATPGSATGDDDLYVESDIELDGELFLGSKVSGAGLTADCDLEGDKLVWDITTEAFSCASDLDLLTLNFAETNITGTATNTQMDRPNSTSLNTTWSEIKMPFAGDVVGISVAMSAARTAGTATFAPFKNDTTTGFTCAINATYTSINQCTQAAGTDSFVAGDNLAMRYTTASYTPTSSEVAANIWVQMTDGADLAELYSASDPDLGAKDVVVLDPQMQDGVKKSTKAYQKGVVGVIATKPGMILGSENLNLSGIPVAVALAGRVPVKVSTESGVILQGDYLTTSSTPGVAMKAVKAGQVIGEAMTDYSGEGVGVVGMFIRNTYYSGSALADLVPIQEQDPPPEDFSKALLVKMFQERDGFAALDEDVGLSELFTDRIAAGLEIITPRLVAQELDVGSIVANNASISGTLTVDTIQANRIEGLEFMIRDQALNMRDLFSSKASESASLVMETAVLSASSSAAVGQTDLSMLTLSGLNVEGFATVSADLNIKGNGLIEGALTVINSISTPNLLVSDFASFFGNVFFKKNVSFEGRPTFNSDIAGFAVINKGDQSVMVEFDEEYSQTPVVTASIALDKGEDVVLQKQLEDFILNGNVSYLITKRSTTGFTIKLNKKAEEDISFSWVALSIKDAKTQSSNLKKNSILNDPEATKSAAFQSVMNQLNKR